jgi:hypothetical protein
MPEVLSSGGVDGLAFGADYFSLVCQLSSTRISKTVGLS